MDRSMKIYVPGLILFGLMVAAFGYALFATPTDAAQGEVYRVIYLHVPSAITAFALAYVLLVASIWSLRGRSVRSEFWGRASAELGLLFTALTLATGSIWGYPTWGVWWTWDARITTTFLLALLYAGYLLLYESLEQGAKRRKACAALGILIAVDVPIIYKSVTWWRTLHQPPSIIREGGSTMEPEMLLALGLSFGAVLLFSIWLVWFRVKVLDLKARLDQASYDQMEG